MDRYRPTNGVSIFTCIVAIMTLGLLILYAVFVITQNKGFCIGGCNNILTDRGSSAEPRSQNDRFSLAKARANIRPMTTVHDNFKKYKFDFTMPTGVHTGWDTDEKTLSTMCKMLTEGLRYAHGVFKGRSSLERARNARLVLAVTENFIIRYKIKLGTKTKPLTGAPWGTDWKVFSIDSTCMLAHYLLLGESAALKREAVDLILSLIQSPINPFGTPTSERSIILRLVGPWILAKYLNGEGDAAADTADYKNAMDQAKVVVRHVNTEKGTHMDHSFFERNLGAFYKYLESMCDDKALYYYGFDTKLVQTPVAEWNAVKSILLHPTVKFGNVGLLGRTQQLKCDTYDESKYGIQVMPFSGYIRYFTKDRQFNARAQIKTLAYYESDKNVNNMGQYWVQYRNVHSSASTDEVKFPDIGFINKAAQTQRIVLPLLNENVDTQTYVPKNAKSFVAAYKHFGVMYQEYEIEEFGDFVVYELIVINARTKVVDVKLKIVNKEAAELNYCGANRSKHVVPANGTKTYTTTMNMVSGVLETKDLAEFPSFPYKLDSSVVIKDVASIKSYMLYENDVPVICTPYEWTYELPNLVHNIDNTYEVFTFDTKNNQYTNIKHTTGSSRYTNDHDMVA